MLPIWFDPRAFHYTFCALCSAPFFCCFFSDNSSLFKNQLLLNLNKNVFLLLLNVFHIEFSICFLLKTSTLLFDLRNSHEKTPNFQRSFPLHHTSNDLFWLSPLSDIVRNFVPYKATYIFCLTTILVFVLSSLWLKDFSFFVCAILLSMLILIFP